MDYVTQGMLLLFGWANYMLNTDRGLFITGCFLLLIILALFVWSLVRETCLLCEAEEEMQDDLALLDTERTDVH